MQKQKQIQTNDAGPDPDFDIEGIKRILERVDQDLFENLQMFVERVLLYRITRAGKKAAELAVLSRILLEAGTMGKDPGVVLRDVSWLESLAKEKLSQSDVSRLFSTMVRATESLNARQLYYLLEKLRSEPITSSESQEL